jgi:hypothetical protein
MVGPIAASEEPDGRQDALLPNPFLISGNEPSPSHQNGTKFDPAQNSASARSTIDVIPAPDFGSVFLPNPVPILDFDGVTETLSPPETPSPNLENEKRDARSYSGDVPLRGIKLFSAVFAELSKHLGKDFSTAELMRASQQLIDLAKDEYVGVIHKDGAERASYYTWDLVRAFISHPWQIAGVETHRIDHCDCDEFSPESFQNAKLLLQGWHERTWEF